MEDPEFRTDLAVALGEISVALFELRDALVELSLSLKDWQFESDLEQRKTAEDTVRQLLAQIASARHPSS